MTVWGHYAHMTGQAIQKGVEGGFHVLEGALHAYGTYKGAMELGGAIAGGLRAAAPMVAALAV